MKGKEALAIQAYARALRQLPIAIAENAGFDANELIHDLEIELKTKPDSGINVDLGCIDSMEKLAITVLVNLFLGMLSIKRTGPHFSKRGCRDDNES